MPNYLRNQVLAAVTLIFLTSSHGALAQDAAPDALRGKRLFLRCASCHQISDRAAPKTGPNLRGIVGRQVGSAPGYAYSPALRALHFTWDEAMLDRWLTNPTSVTRGTTMAFAGLSRARDRKALIAYLKAASQ